MQVTPAKLLITPTRLRPQQDKPTPQSTSHSANNTHPRFSSEVRERKRKDIDDDDDDDEDCDYTPRKRSKRHKATLRNSIDKALIAKSRPTRRAPSPVHDSEERPIIRSIEHRGARLPATSKTKRKPPAKASNINQKSANPTSTETNINISNLVDEGVEYIGTLERSRASSTLGVGALAEKFPLSPTSDTQITPTVKVEQNIPYTDSALRRATAEKAAALQVAGREEIPAPSTKSTVPVIDDRHHPPTGSEPVHTTNDIHKEDARITNTSPESRSTQYVQEQGGEAQHIPSNDPSTKEQHHALPTRDLPLQPRPEQHMPGNAQFTKERPDSFPRQDPQRPKSPTQHQPALKPQISYYVVTRPNGRLTLLQWLDGSLVGKTIDTLFDEVASLAGARDIKSINLKLTTSQKDAVCVVPRNDIGAFEVTKRKFSRLINEDLRTGNTEFEIELDPGRVEPQGQMETKGDDIDPGFSFG